MQTLAVWQCCRSAVAHLASSAVGFTTFEYRRSPCVRHRTGLLCTLSERSGAILRLHVGISDGRCLRGGETIGRGQRDERGVVGVRVGASSSPEREEL